MHKASTMRLFDGDDAGEPAERKYLLKDIHVHNPLLLSAGYACTRSDMLTI